MVSQLVGYIICIFYSTRFLLYCCSSFFLVICELETKASPERLSAYLIWGAAQMKAEISYRNSTCTWLRGFFYLFIYFHICVNVFQTNQNSDGASNLQTNWELELRIGNTTRRRGKATVLGVFVGPKLCKSRGDQREAARTAADAEI